MSFSTISAENSGAEGETLTIKNSGDEQISIGLEMMGFYEPVAAGETFSVFVVGGIDRNDLEISVTPTSVAVFGDWVVRGEWKTEILPK